MDKARCHQITGGIFLIGLAFIFVTSFWWPGILFLLGLTTILNGFIESGRSEQIGGGFFLLGLGVIFAIGFEVWMLLLILGIVTIAGAFFKSEQGQETVNEWMDKPKRKRDELI